MHREQQGYVYRRSGWWILRYRQTVNRGGKLETTQPAIKLVPYGPHYKTKRSVEDLAAEKLEEINQQNRQPQMVVTVADFVDNVYLPHVTAHKRPSTQKCYRDIWEDHCKVRAGDKLIRQVRTSDCQRWIEAIAREDVTKSKLPLGHQSLKHIKSVLSAIFSHAKRQGFFDGVNPVRDTAIPPAPKGGDTYAYNLEEINTILAVLPEPAATVFAVASFMGLRRGEIRGLLWENYTDGEIHITQSIWNGHVTEPKTKRSAAPVPVIKQLRERLELHRLSQGNPAIGPIFRNVLGTSLDLNNLLGRTILPVLNRCAVCGKGEAEHIKAAVDHKYQRDEQLPQWRGWHAARRGLGSNLYRLGVPELVIQRILRHSNVATTTGYYIKTSSEDVRKAMTEFEENMTQNSALCAQRALKTPKTAAQRLLN
jgi:integrase